MLISIMLLSVLALIGIDQLTKWLAQLYLKGNPPFVLIDGVFELHYIDNPGAAFGIFKGHRIMLITVTVIALIVLALAFAKGYLGKSKIVVIGCTLIFAGGIGNLIDRVFRHEVIDFFYFKLIDFAIFNMADSFVVVGASLMLIYFLFINREKLLLGEVDADGVQDTDRSARQDGGEA